MGTMRNAYSNLIGKSERKRPLGKSMGGCELDSSDSGQGTGADCCEHRNEPPGSIKSREFLD
jgi:hypothetical protein